MIETDLIPLDEVRNLKARAGSGPIENPSPEAFVLSPNWLTILEERIAELDRELAKQDQA